MNLHTHRQSRSKRNLELRGLVSPFYGPVSAYENVKAHGGYRYIEICACGAARDVNANGSHREYSAWTRR